MPRKQRVVVPHMPHHVVQRGNYQQFVFEKSKDFRTYLYLIKENMIEYDLKVHAYCLMGNHVHLIITPSDATGLAEMFRNVHARYSQYKNLIKGRLGHLWQGRFYSCVLDPGHLVRAIRYVEMNPVRAQMVKYPWDYIWSSTRQHVGLEHAPIFKTDFHHDCQEAGLSRANWRNFLLKTDKKMLKEIRRKTSKGLALGSEDFIENIEKCLGISLRELKVGRPKNGDRGVCP